MLNLLKWGKSFSFYTKLGRWKIEHDIKIINIKIDQANQDNSGTYHFEKFDTDEKILKNKEHNFLVPYCM